MEKMGKEQKMELPVLVICSRLGLSRGFISLTVDREVLPLTGSPCDTWHVTDT